MSFLADGASCAAGSNPLTQLASKQSIDRSLQRNHVQASHTGPSSLRGGEHRQLSQQDQQLFKQMQQSDMRPDAFRFDDMRREVSPSAWASEFNGMKARMPSGVPMSAQPQQHQPQHQPQHQSQPQVSEGPSSWANEFHTQMQNPTTGAYSQSGYMPMSHMGPRLMGGSTFGGMAPGATFGVAQNQQLNMPTEKLDGVDNSKWEEQFSRIELEQAQGTDVASSATADQMAQSSVAQDQSINDMQENDFAQDVEDALAGPEAAEFLDNSFPPNWDQIWDQINDNEANDGSVHTRGGILDRGSSTGYTYEFAKENEYANEEDPFALGVYMMDNGAKLSCAVLCFEEAVKRDPQHVEAWARLGDAQAQNEVEEQATIALEKAVLLDPHHKTALLNLAISYTNEGYDTAASQILDKWIMAKYPEIAELVPTARPGDRDALHGRVTEMFLKAAQKGSSTGTIDPDIQVGLGVLYYRDDDYTKAVDCFRAALAVRPNDASLWNRLGATLANASRPEDAIEAYYKALELRPSFVRARYNLAVSCINIGCYKEAADHLLSAMSLHETEEGTGIDFDRSANLVETLRRVFFAMDRRDLLVKLRPDMRLGEFREEFNF